MYLTFFLTLLTLIAFAANSVLCRMALASHSIGAPEFTFLRILSGILILTPVFFFCRKRTDSTKATTTPWHWRSIVPSLALFSYALFFSLAYIQLSTATGALILFASVQITMVSVSIYLGNKVTGIEWLGFTLAFGGLVYLLAPGLSAPPFIGACMMLIAGISWGAYSLLGKQEPLPIFATARNFLYCLPACLLLLMFIIFSNNASPALSYRGITLAVISGAITSGLGYVLWYITLKRITTTVASISQLAVPVIAGLSGIMFLNEQVNPRLIAASVLIIGGIVTAILAKRQLVTRHR